MDIQSIDFIDITHNATLNVPYVRKQEIEEAKKVVVDELDKNNIDSTKYRIMYADGFKDQSEIKLYIVVDDETTMPKNYPARLYVVKDNEIIRIADKNNKILHKK